MVRPVDEPLIGVRSVVSAYLVKRSMLLSSMLYDFVIGLVTATPTEPRSDLGGLGIFPVLGNPFILSITSHPIGSHIRIYSEGASD